MGNNIEALATTAKANLIVDDISYPDEPFFQDGQIAQAINQVTTADNVTYFSAAANQGNGGYLSAWRQASGTVTGIGSGTFFNFDPTGGTLLGLPVTVNNTGPSVPLTFQFDQPFTTQQPAGSTATVTSSLSFYAINTATGAVISSTNNNVNTQIPFQFVTLPVGSYDIYVQLVSGPAPGHIQFSNTGDSPNLVINQTYGAPGSYGIYYPTSVGHETAANTIGVGAVPWWAPAPYLGTNPLNNEPYSSTGPGLYTLNPNGTPMTTPDLVLNPAVTAPDGGNTSFFIPGYIIDTSNAATLPAGDPTTATNLSQDLPSFFGTSAACENAAAVAALMLQKVPGLTSAEIRAGLVASAASTPMNGSTAGTWNDQGGYGLINAVKAINAVDLLRVASTDPTNGATLTVTPSAIQVTFNKPVVFSTISSSDIQFTATPAGVSVVLGTPIAVDNPTDPTIVDFPFSFSYKNPPTTSANGTYTFLVSGPVMSEDGKTLVPSNPITFTLNDTTAPEVANTSLFTRTVTIQFNKAMNPSTITLANVYVERQGGTGNWLTPINLNNYPGASISYNPLTFTATLNYAALPQTAMPTDDYAIVVKSGPTGVTDLVGNELDGAFSGSFPSGNGTPGTSFFEDLGLKTLQAPVLTTFQMTAATDTGIAGDQNTNISQPQFIGQVYNSFPGTVANLQVYVEFNGLHPSLNGGFDLGVGGGGRGYTGTYDVSVSTNSAGTFSVSAPFLPEGYQSAMVVVVGQADLPPLPGLSSQQQHAFRIDKTAPSVTGIGQINGAASFAGESLLAPVAHSRRAGSGQSAVHLPGNTLANPLPGHRPFDRIEHQQLLAVLAQ